MSDENINNNEDETMALFVSAQRKKKAEDEAQKKATEEQARREAEAAEVARMERELVERRRRAEEKIALENEERGKALGMEENQKMKGVPEVQKPGAAKASKGESEAGFSALKSKLPIFIGIGAAAVIAIVLVIIFVVKGSGSKDSASASGTEATPTSDIPTKANKLKAGIYYDAYTYDNSGIYYCIVLRNTGDAYIGMQDTAYGSWEPEGTISIPSWGKIWKCEIVDGELRCPEGGFIYVKSPFSETPDSILDYYTDGSTVSEEVSIPETDSPQWNLSDTCDVFDSEEGTIGIYDNAHDVAMIGPIDYYYTDEMFGGLLACDYENQSIVVARNVNSEVESFMNGSTDYFDFLINDYYVNVMDEFEEMYGEIVKTISVEKFEKSERAEMIAAINIVVEDQISEFSIEHVMYYREDTNDYIVKTEFYPKDDKDTKQRLNKVFSYGVNN